MMLSRTLKMNDWMTLRSSDTDCIYKPRSQDEDVDREDKISPTSWLQDDVEF